MSALELGADGLAAYRLTRLLRRDTITDPLRDWVWKWKKLNLAFAITYDDSTGPVAIPIPELEIEMGANLIDGPFLTQKEILKYRNTFYSQLGSGPPPWNYSIDLGATMFYGPIRNDGVLITSGGVYEYGVNLVLDVTTEANSGRLSTDPRLGTGTYFATCDFLGTNVPMFEELTSPSDTAFAGVITISGLELW